MVECAGVGRRCIRSEGESGEIAAEVDEPGFQHRWRYEIDLVQDEDQPFRPGVCGGDFSFDFSRASAVGIAGVKDVEKDV